MNNRKFLVKVADALSDLISVCSGVPQGSCLGPLFFILYVNNIFGTVNKCKLFMYADDAILIFSHRNGEECRKVLQNELDCIVKWSIKNFLFINSEKTKVMFFRTSHMEKIRLNKIILHKLSCLQSGSKDDCNCQRLQYVPHCNYLGVIFDENLKFSKHVDLVFDKGKRILCCMYALKNYVNGTVLKIVYKALFESIMRYGVQVWGGTGAVHLSKLVNLQMRALKLIIRDRNFSNSKLLDCCNTQTPSGFYKYYHLVSNFCVNEYKQIVVSGYEIRRKKYNVPRTFNSYGEKTMRCLVPKLYNALPNSISELESIGEFKKAVSLWLRENS